MPTGSKPSPRQGVQWRLVAWALVGLYALAFLLLNNDKTSVNFVFFTVETRLIWLILLSMGLGAVLMFLGPHLLRRHKAGGKPEPPPSSPPSP